MGEKVTVMILKVDLQCPCCYKKVKKILCKFPQIRDQVYDEKANEVTVTVVCCSPEKFRDKLCCKGCKVIKSIEIVEPPKPKPKPKPEEKPAPTLAPEPPTPAPTPAPEPPTPAPRTCCGPCSEGYGGGPCYHGPVGVGCPPRTCCGPCSEGYGGGPCYHGYGVPPPPQPCYDGYYWYGYGHERPCHITRCDYYFNDPQACSIM